MCNCYNILKTQFKAVPFMNQIIAGASMKYVGNVAVFMYPANKDFPNGMPHVALVKDILPDGSVLIGEYHYHGCTYSERIIDSTTRGLIGYVTL
jgi:surface antigen